MRHVFLSLFAVFCYSYAMNYEPEQHGYSQQERAGMAGLVKKATAKPEGSHKRMTEAERAEALKTLFGG